MQSLSIYNSQPSMQQPITRRLEQYFFGYPDRHQINIHQSTVSDSSLFYVRLVSFLYLSAIYLWTLSQMTSIFQNVQYLTLVGYFTTWLYFGLCIQDYLLNSSKIRVEGPVVKKLDLYIEIIHEISLCVQVPITIVFWAVLFQLLLDSPTVTQQQIALNANLHAGPMLCLLIQFMLNHFSFHIRHIPIIIAFDITYLLINLGYSLAVKPIYQPIDWISYLSYLLSFTAVFLSLFVHFVARLIHRKWKVHRRRSQPQGRETLLGSTIANQPTTENQTYGDLHL